VDHVPRSGYDYLNNFFESFFMAANTLIRHTIDLLSTFDADKGGFATIPEIRAYYPEPLKEVMRSMQRVIEGVGHLRWGDVRANVVEPHLGYCLRKLEMDLQPGIGVGHSLCGIFEIRKE
jgi:hypothetical protein